jgi:hypothetical protein
MATNPNDSGFDLKDAGLDREAKDEKKQKPIDDRPIMEASSSSSVSADVYIGGEESGSDIAEDELDPKQAAIAQEDRVARRRLILEIQRYYSSPRFRAFLVQTGLVESLAELAIPEMQQLLRDIRFTIQNKNTGEMIQRGVPHMICAIEPLVSTVYDIKGLSNMLSTSESFKDILEEVALESQTFSDTPATTRLFYEVVKTAFFTHELRDAQKKAIKEKEVTMSSKLSDLLSAEPKPAV